MRGGRRRAGPRVAEGGRSASPGRLHLPWPREQGGGRARRRSVGGARRPSGRAAAGPGFPVAAGGCGGGGEAGAGPQQC